MPRPAFPKSILEFQEQFGAEEACWQYLFDSRWPEGFVCPKCSGRKCWYLPSRGLVECAGCKRHVSVTAGTVMHRTRTPLRLWFWAAYLMTTNHTGISAVSLQRQLGLSRYETAWLMLHRFRKAMVNAEHTRLSGEVEVEVDEFELGGTEPGRRGGRQLDVKAVKAIVAIEVRGAGSGRIRMRTITDTTAKTLGGFVRDNVESDAILHTDGWGAYKHLANDGYDHRPRSQLKAKREGDTEPVMPRAHRAISNLKAWQHGTHRWVSAEHTQAYLDEYVFRHNRRANPMAAFQRLLGLGAAHEPVTRQQIMAEGPGPRPRNNLS